MMGDAARYTRDGQALSRFFRSEGYVVGDLLEIAGQIATEASKLVIRLTGKQAGEELEHNHSKSDEFRHRKRCT
jgi:hypothetical protein